MWFLVHGIPFNQGGGQPPYPTTGPGFPTNPIAGMGPGGNFPGGGGGGGGGGGYPTHPWMPPWGPSHPIAPGGPPPGIWGPIGNYPDAGFPGPQPGQPPQIWGGPYFPPYATTGPGFPTAPIVIPLPPNMPGAPEGGGAVAVIPAGTTIVSTQEIEIPNPMDPANPYKIPAGTAIVTSQAILVPTGYKPPSGPSTEHPEPQSGSKK